jgi:ubiquinone/menaquinone biosynthesis C-methylase UbiE
MSETVRSSVGNTAPEPALDHRRAHWDRRAETYELDYVRAPIRVRVLDEIFRDLPRTRRTALDAGTGTGRTLARLVAHLPPGSDIVGSDVSEGMLAQARATVVPGEQTSLTFVGADNADLPFPAGKFDLILSTFTLHHVPPTQQLTVLTEFRRVLADRGQLILADQIQPDPPFDADSMREAVTDAFYPHLAHDQAMARLSEFGEWPLQVTELNSLLLAAGFRSKVTVLHPIVAVVHALPLSSPAS